MSTACPTSLRVAFVGLAIRRGASESAMRAASSARVWWVRKARRGVLRTSLNFLRRRKSTVGAGLDCLGMFLHLG